MESSGFNCGWFNIEGQSTAVSGPVDTFLFLHGISEGNGMGAFPDWGPMAEDSKIGRQFLSVLDNSKANGMVWLNVWYFTAS
jgi:hypothetical protein